MLRNVTQCYAGLLMKCRFTHVYAILRMLRMLRMITLIYACYAMNTQCLRNVYAMFTQFLRAYSTIIYALLRNLTHVLQYYACLRMFTHDMQALRINHASITHQLRNDYAMTTQYSLGDHYAAITQNCVMITQYYTVLRMLRSVTHRATC